MLPRYFPRAPAKVSVVGATEQGLVATHGSMRLLLRNEPGLPDSAAFLVAASVAGAETGGAPTGAPPASSIEVPKRLGGGWLFVVGRELWHAPSWLERPQRLFAFNAAPRVFIGTDALVAQEPGRAAFAFDVAGQSLPLRRWPVSPAIAELATRDAKHAAVVADLRGLSITEDGGESWREIASARTPIGVRVAAGGYLVRGRNGGDERETSWRIDVHGDVRAELDAASVPAPATSNDASELRALPTAAWERVIAHGYQDHARARFVVFDHGLLETYRTSDGALLTRAVVGDARASCRTVHWPSAKPGEDPGFACLGPDGTTLWRVGERGAVRVARYQGQRRVWSSEVGTLALEGACEGDPATAGTTTLCVWGRHVAGPTTVRLRGFAVDDRVLPLRDGSVVVLRPPSGPPHARRLAEMFVDRAPKANGAGPEDRAPKANGAGPERANGVPLQPPGAVAADVAAMLANGHWLDNVEALENGELALWIEQAGRLLGVRVRANGQLDVGPRSAIAAVHRTAGLHSLSWSAGGAGFESIDGGLRYTQIGLPATDAAAPPAQPPTRKSLPKPPPSRVDKTTAAEAGCTSIGCILPTLLRVGWGAAQAGATESTAPRPSPAGVSSPVRIQLECSLTQRSADAAQPAARPPRLRAPGPGKPPQHAFGVASTGSLPFYGLAAPKVRAEQILQGWDTVDLADRRSRTFLGRVHLWGVSALGFEPDAGWQWRWYDTKTRSVHASGIARPPEELALQQQLQLQSGTLARGSWYTAASSDPRRAIGIHSDGLSSMVFSLVDGEAPSAIELEDGTSFGILDSAIAAPGDRTLLAGAVGDPAGTAVYLARGSRAEPIARIPRLGVQGKPGPALVALHTDGVRIAVAVADGEVASRSEAAFYLREVYPTDAPVRRVGASGGLHACTAGSQGFEAWAKLDLASDLKLSGALRTARLQNPTRARLRFGDDGSVCIAEATSGIDVEDADTLATMPTRAAPPGSVPLAIGHGGRLHVLACAAPVDK